jgi:hypothetical protein
MPGLGVDRTLLPHEGDVAKDPEAPSAVQLFASRDFLFDNLVGAMTSMTRRIAVSSIFARSADRHASYKRGAPKWVKGSVSRRSYTRFRTQTEIA